MNKYFLFTLFLFLLVQVLQAQNPTPNSGFENWTLINNSYEVPDNWDNLNPETSLVGVLTCIKSSDVHSGNYSAKLETKTVFTQTANGIVTTGHLIVAPPYGVNGGIPYSMRPDSMVGWFKYAPAAGDSTQIEFDLLDTNGDSIGTAVFQTAQTITSWTRFSAPVIYFSSANPDTSRWLISSSNGYNAVVGSVLYVDDLDLIFNTGIDEDGIENGMVISPNPTSDGLHITRKNSEPVSILVSDESGREMKTISLSNEESNVDVSDLNEGIYFYRITDSHGKNDLNGKFVVIH